MSPRRLWRALLARPGLWLALLAWPALVLVAVLLTGGLVPGEGPVLSTIELGVVLSALLVLAAVAYAGVRAYRGALALRRHLFQGDYDQAYQALSRYPALAEGVGLESALRRVIEFDRIRAARVSAATRLFDRLLREAPVPMLIADLAREEVRFSSALCQLLELKERSFSLDSLLRPEANAEFARLWETVARGRQTRAQGTLGLRLPVRGVSRRLEARLLGVQDDSGAIAHVLGFFRPVEQTPPDDPQAGDQGSPADRTTDSSPTEGTP
ncbi:MAG: hypothetical protein ACLF0G_04670 [Candidatus Brocadiia bacterium]